VRVHSQHADVMRGVCELIAMDDGMHSSVPCNVCRVPRRPFLIRRRMGVVDFSNRFLGLNHVVVGEELMAGGKYRR